MSPDSAPPDSSAPDTATQPEVLLAAAGVTRVVRVGATVRRPDRPFTATVQAFLAHLHARGFHEAPRPLGRDEQGREVLSYVEGAVPTEPLPDWATSAESLAALARLVRRLHDAAEDWRPPPTAVFGAIPGTAPDGVRPLFEVAELVSHQDYCPGNVVFCDGLPAALIDFDLARPTTRVADVVNALYWWVPLVDPVDRPPAATTADAAERVRLFADAYGMDPGRRAAVVPTAVQRARNATLTMRAAAEVDPVFRRWWDEGLEDRLPRAERWIAAHADRIHERLTR